MRKNFSKNFKLDKKIMFNLVYQTKTNQFDQSIGGRKLPNFRWVA